MKRFFPLLLILSLFLALPAFAVEGEDIGDQDVVETITTETESGSVTVNVIVPASDPAEVPEESPVSDPQPSYDIYTTYALDGVADSDAQQDDAAQFRDVLVNLFGEYTPRTQTVTEYLSDGSTVSYTEVIPGVAGMDFPWLASVALFGLVLFSLFKLIGGLLKL